LERINQYEFYELARKLGGINDLPSDTPLDAERVFWAAFWAQTHATQLLQGSPTELGLSRGKAEALLAAVNGVIARNFTAHDETGKPDWKFPVAPAPQIEAWEWGGVRAALSNFEMIFAEEMGEAATYRVPNRGIFNTRKLVDEADCTFPQVVAGYVPEKAKLEWRAAGRCLAFGMFTACGFHVARSVEGMLEAYFHAFSGGLNKKSKQWGEYLDALEKVAASQASLSPSLKTLGELKQLKDDWRNPLMHPRVVLEEPDARAVFNNGETLVMMMAQELAAASAKGAQPPLALVASANDPT
jgi:hypothetical protein